MFLRLWSGCYTTLGGVYSAKAIYGHFVSLIDNRLINPAEITWCQSSNYRT